VITAHTASTFLHEVESPGGRSSPACLECGLFCPPQADTRDTSGQAARVAQALAGLTPSQGRGAACVPVQAAASAGGDSVPSLEQLEQLAAELRERERVLRLREEALRRRDGRVTDVIDLT
jgi:hypothetical protein